MNDIPNYEIHKNLILEAFYENRLDEVKNLCLVLLNREYYKDDISYDIFAKNFLWEIELDNDNLEKAKEYFKDVFSLKIDDEEIALDDLLIYFLQWNSYIKYKNIQVYLKEINMNWEETQNQYDKLNSFLFKWFQYFPKNEFDFYDDLENNLREKIIDKYSWIIDRSYYILWLNMWTREKIFNLEKIKNSEWKTTNYIIIDTKIWKEITYFWYKRTDYYWDTF